MTSNEYGFISMLEDFFFADRRFAMDDHKDEARFAWGAMGDLIESSGFFPVTINVPDMISNMYEAWHQMMDFMFGSVNESAPRILEFLKALDHDLPDLE